MQHVFLCFCLLAVDVFSRQHRMQTGGDDRRGHFVFTTYDAVPETAVDSKKENFPSCRKFGDPAVNGRSWGLFAPGGALARRNFSLYSRRSVGRGPRICDRKGLQPFNVPAHRGAIQI
jgi:hypothetical protein